MRKMARVGATALIVLAVATAAALAQDYPDMVGVWKGHVEGVIIGDPDHFMSAVEAGDPEKPRIAEFDITVDIVEQEGRLIWGTISGGGTSEPWLGTISRDGKGLRAVDGNGFVDGRILSADEFENCYLHTGGTIVASCAIMKRE